MHGGQRAMARPKAPSPAARATRRKAGRSTDGRGGSQQRSGEGDDERQRRLERLGRQQRSTARDEGSHLDSAARRPSGPTSTYMARATTVISRSILRFVVMFVFGLRLHVFPPLRHRVVCSYGGARNHHGWVVKSGRQQRSPRAASS